MLVEDGSLDLWEVLRGFRWKESMDSAEDLYGVKVLRAHGGCLGADGRRRTWQAAKSRG